MEVTEPFKFLCIEEVSVIKSKAFVIKIIISIQNRSIQSSDTLLHRIQIIIINYRSLVRDSGRPAAKATNRQKNGSAAERRAVSSEQFKMFMEIKFPPETESSVLVVHQKNIRSILSVAADVRCLLR